MKALVKGVALGAMLIVAGPALADPIEGRWRTDAGSTAQISSCGASYCIRMISGEHTGKQIGELSPAGGNSYKGMITDPANDKSYRGDGTITGNSLKMRGCVMAVFCRSQNWTRM